MRAQPATIDGTIGDLRVISGHLTLASRVNLFQYFSGIHRSKKIYKLNAPIE